MGAGGKGHGESYGAFAFKLGLYIEKSVKAMVNSW